MTNQEANEIIQELLKQNPDKLTEKGKRLFEAIMKIADERDYYKKQCKHYEEVREYFKRTRDCYEEFE